MTDDHCACPLWAIPDDPYYQCPSCERRQEALQREEDLEMTEHRIFLDARPATPTSGALAAGYFGHVPGVGMNEFIYCRVSRESAYTYGPHEAVRQIQEIWDKGYPARCEPPVAITFDDRPILGGSRSEIAQTRAA
jgi:hypothetical protein